MRAASETGTAVHRIQKLLVVSHVVHYQRGDRIYAYGPYAREIDIWADLFPRLAIASPVRSGDPPGDCIPFSRSNIELVPQRETGGTTASAKLRQLLAVPSLLLGLGRAMASADAIHVRCPGNLGLLGVILAPLFSQYIVAKYTSAWAGYPTEPWTWRLQRALLRSFWWRGPVTVYGGTSNQSENVISFFTSVLNEKQLARAGSAASKAKVNDPMRLLYVGRLSVGKNVDVLISAVAALKSQGIASTCMIVGEGPQRPALEAQIAAFGLRDYVELVGGVSLDCVLDYYERADICVLVSESEGWGKATAEAMAFGLICIGSNQGFALEMLGEGRGICVPPGDVSALTAVLCAIAARPEAYESMRREAAAWASRYSLQGLQNSLRELLRIHWKWEAGGLERRPQV